jgi:heptosyltransferase I
MGNRRQLSGPRILVVRTGAMGDVIHALPAVASLKHSFPGSQLVWAIDAHWAPLLEGNPFVDAVVPIRRKTFSGIAEAWRKLREQEFDFAVDLQGLMKSALIASIARADRIFGYHQSQVREWPAALAYSTKVKASAAHVVDRHLELVRQCGATSVVISFPLPPGVAEGSLPETGYILASPFAGWAAKQWPLESYARLAALLRDSGLSLVLNVAPRQAGLLAEHPDVAAHVSGLAGLIYATRFATAVIGVDSGPLHLAAALGKPGVAIFGPTSPERNGPYGTSFTVLRSAGAATSYKRLAKVDESMAGITPEAVCEALRVKIVATPEQARRMA